MCICVGVRPPVAHVFLFFFFNPDLGTPLTRKRPAQKATWLVYLSGGVGGGSCSHTPVILALTCRASVESGADSGVKYSESS